MLRGRSPALLRAALMASTILVATLVTTLAAIPAAPVAAATATAVDAAELQALVSESWGPPLVLPGSQDAGLDGLLPDIYRELAGRLGVRLRLVLAPRRRLTHMGLSTDLWCHTVPRWMSTEEAGRFVWSAPVCRRSDLVVARRRPDAPPPPPQPVEALTGTVATGLGYAYPGLAEAFDRGRLVRSDTRHEGAILEKVAADRADLGIVNDLVLAWHLRTDPELAERLAVVGQVETVPIACALAPDGPHRDAILTALAAMAADGTLRRLLERWGETTGPS